MSNSLSLLHNKKRILKLHLAKHACNKDYAHEFYMSQITDTLHYNKIIGNTYAASMYIGLISLLEHSKEDLAGKRIGLYSYGSGCVGEFFSGEVMPGYQKFLVPGAHVKLLNSRTELSYEKYKEFYSYSIPEVEGDHRTPKNETGLFRFAGISAHKRIYQRLL